MRSLEEIERAFTYQSPKGDQPERYTKINEAAKAFALLVFDLCPDSRERSKALTGIQECRMWANASIALNE